MTAAWSFLTLEESERQFAGNAGYPDVLGLQYVFDSTVANQGRVQAGDLAVLRDRQYVLGAGWIDVVSSSDGEKTRSRCPKCGFTGFKKRVRMTPRYLCSHCGEAFEDPAEEVLSVVVRIADYGRTWRSSDLPIPVELLSSAYQSRAAQHSIRQLDLPKVRALLAGYGVDHPAWWRDDGGVRPTPAGGHTLRLGRVRRGQQQFREELLARFGANCAVTGPQPGAALEAAHLYRFSEMPDHDLNAGLMLRADLHRLFDRWLIAIDPEGWTVHVSPALMAFPDLAALDGSPLAIDPELRPSIEHVRAHYKLATEGWSA